jgi:hypothetical protein
MIQQDENKAAESSAAAVAEPEFNVADQYTWTPEQREHWNETGKQPEPPKKKQEAEPAASPAKEEKSEPKGKTEAEPETAPKQGKKERKPGEKLSADERIAQVLAENKELKAKLERSSATEPKPSAEKSEPAKAAEAPKRPNPFTWDKTPAEFETAMEAWEASQRQLAVQDFQRSEAAKAQQGKLRGQMEEVKGKYPDAESKITATYESFSKVQMPGVILSMLNDSEVLPELMYVLSDEDTRSNFIETMKTQPGKAVRALAQMEADIVGASKAKGKEKSEPEEPAERKPRAPKPPSEVGGRGAAGDDPLRTAAEAGDFHAFDQEMRHRKFATK